MLAELLADENNASIKVVRFSGLDKTHLRARRVAEVPDIAISRISPASISRIWLPS